MKLSGTAQYASCFHKSKVLGFDDIYDAQARCPVCHYEGDRQAGVVLQEGPLIRLLSCPQCKGQSASWMPTTETLKAYYSNYYADDSEMVTFHGIQRLARHILRKISLDKLGTPLRILDFGGGDGSLSIEMGRMIHQQTKRPIELTLVEYQTPNSNNVPDFITFHHAFDLDSLAAPEKSFDLVLASAILEHIPEVHDVFHGLFRLMKPGGYFYARTPCMAPLIQLLPFVDFTYPGHVHDMGASFWNRVPALFNASLRIVASTPSIVETQLDKAFVRTVAAYTLKSPAYLEQVVNKGKDRLWNYTGGWEVIFQAGA